MSNVAGKIVFFGDESVTNVTKSGIADEALRAAIDDGLLEIRRSTELDAKTDPGSRAWGAVIRGLRRELLTNDNEWSFSFVKGLNLTHNKAKGLNIIVMSGDKYTGLLDGSPKSKNPKGAATSTLVGENYDFFYEQDTVVQISDIDPTINYVFLYFFDFGKKEVRYELSIPIGMTGSAEKTRIAAWKERNIFQAIPFIQKVILVKEEFTEVPDFEVIRK
ncbi:hypothetical protein KKJ01_14610 [Xenorhabdus bovienii]|uniref:Uncharacterized protein n=1 Tax=Xenorhabdus bovienii TaxID=40576 RepID=A0AAJ1JB42_XENBV|nr:hypothetical protein [Xenorhabdus bovienii]MDE1479431.1 hypothetical protein [Xenorhabdus bovienii]MDE9511082.1 hypothetical protein [Xenorhabdus bovienii]MDE9522739.1 hypothetical protein [Xenorhabdus bovienii]